MNIEAVGFHPVWLLSRSSRMDVIGAPVTPLVIEDWLGGGIVVDGLFTDDTPGGGMPCCVRCTGLIAPSPLDM
jgi:hypothetical protein